MCHPCPTKQLSEEHANQKRPHNKQKNRGLKDKFHWMVGLLRSHNTLLNSQPDLQRNFLGLQQDFLEQARSYTIHHSTTTYTTNNTTAFSTFRSSHWSETTRGNNRQTSRQNTHAECWRIDNLFQQLERAIESQRAPTKSPVTKQTHPFPPEPPKPRITTTAPAEIQASQLKHPEHQWILKQCHRTSQKQKHRHIKANKTHSTKHNTGHQSGRQQRQPTHHRRLRRKRKHANHHTHTQNYHTQKHTLHLIQSSLARRDHMRKFRLQQQLTYSEQKTLNLTNTTARLGQRLGQLLGRRRNVNDMRITRTYERLPPAKSLFMSSRKREYPKHIARSGRCVCVCVTISRLW